MARVLLVESDSAMRENLREIFARLRPEFVLAGEALDGESALQMLADLSPDILIIERQLPFMDGVALWQKARRMQPWVQGIVIGGRDDPESVRSAGAMGIEEYLLRPVTAYGMRDALERAEGRIRMTAGMMREKIAAARCVVMPQRREAEMRFGLWLRDGVGHACEVRQRGRYCRLLRVEGGGGLAADIARLIEYDCGDGVVAMELEREVLLAVTGDVPEKVEEWAYSLAHTLHSAMMRFGGGPVQIGVGACVDAEEALRASYFELLALSQDARRPVLGAGDVMRRNPGVRPPVNALGEMLMCADAEALEAVVARYRRTVDDAGYAVAEALEVLAEEVGERLPRWDGPLDAQFVRAAVWRDEVAPWLQTLPLSRARCFTALNFGKPGLSAHEVAAHVGMTPMRFGVVFAQEMGMSFTEYLNRQRVSGAKALLAGTRMRISTVAQTVGVPEVGRLNALFCEVTGMEPKDFRRKYGKND